MRVKKSKTGIMAQFVLIVLCTMVFPLSGWKFWWEAFLLPLASLCINPCSALHSMRMHSEVSLVRQL